MAKPKDTTTKPKTSIFLCCFGSSHAKESTTKGSDPIISKKKKKKTSWFSGRSIRILLIHKKSGSKTMPLEASISDHAHYSKSRSKSTLQHKSQAPPVLPGTPYYTPTQVFTVDKYYVCFMNLTNKICSYVWFTKKRKIK